MGKIVLIVLGVFVGLNILGAVAVVGYNAYRSGETDGRLRDAAESVADDLQGLAAFDAGVGFDNWSAYIAELTEYGDLPDDVTITTSGNAGETPLYNMVTPWLTQSASTLRFELDGRAACLTFVSVAPTEDWESEYVIQTGPATAAGGIFGPRTCRL